jgi:hypothetical protein
VARIRDIVHAEGLGAFVKTVIVDPAARVGGTFEDVIIGADPPGFLDGNDQRTHGTVSIYEQITAFIRAVLPAGIPAFGPAG